MFGTPLTRAGARHRPRRLPADARREPDGLERQPVHRAGLPRPRATRCASAAASSWWSIRAAARRPRSPIAHVAIRPGTDALLLAGMVNTLFAEGLVRLGRLAEWTDGVAAVEQRARALHTRARRAGLRRRAGAGPRARARARGRAPRRGLRAHRHHHHGLRHARLLAGRRAQRADRQPRPRGRRDVPEGAGLRGQHRRPRPGAAAGARLHRHRSRVRGAPEVFGEFPIACLAEEIETPGAGQIRALITIAGNPARSAPNSARLARALASLDFMVSVDIYLNETTRHADVILPGPSPLEQSHYDVAFPSVRGAQRRALLAAGLRAAAGRHDRVGDPAAPARHPARPGPEGRHERARRARDPRCACRRPSTRKGSPRPRPRPGGDPRGAGAAPRTRAPDRSGAAHGPLRRRLRRAPRASRWPRSRRRRTASTSARSSRACPRCCARRAAKIELAPQLMLDDLPRLEASLDARRDPARAGRPPPPALEQLLDAQPADAGEGPLPLHAAGAPGRRGAPLARRRRRRARALEGGRAWWRGRGHRRDPARVSSACRTAGATTRPARACRWPRSAPAATATCSPTSSRSTRSPAPRR